MSHDPPGWRPGFYTAGNVVTYARRVWRCVSRTAGRPFDRSPAWVALDPQPITRKQEDRAG